MFGQNEQRHVVSETSTGADGRMPLSPDGMGQAAPFAFAADVTAIVFSRERMSR